jgi:hypothetical protein
LRQHIFLIEEPIQIVPLWENLLSFYKLLLLRAYP